MVSAIAPLASQNFILATSLLSPYFGFRCFAGGHGCEVMVLANHSALRRNIFFITVRTAQHCHCRKLRGLRQECTYSFIFIPLLKSLLKKKRKNCWLVFYFCLLEALYDPNGGDSRECFPLSLFFLFF